MHEERFGLSFNEKCADGYADAATDFDRLRRAMKDYGVIWLQDLNGRASPTDAQVFDLLEYSYEVLADGKQPCYHSYISHWHYSYDRDIARAKFTRDVNRIFERNGMAFEMQEGEVLRLAPTVLHEALATSTFHTGDSTLDNMLETAREKFLNPSVDVRRESLENFGTPGND